MHQKKQQCGLESAMLANKKTKKQVVYKHKAIKVVSTPVFPDQRAGMTGFS